MFKFAQIWFLVLRKNNSIFKDFQLIDIVYEDKYDGEMINNRRNNQQFQSYHSIHKIDKKNFNT